MFFYKGWKKSDSDYWCDDEGMLTQTDSEVGFHTYVARSGHTEVESF